MNTPINRRGLLQSALVGGFTVWVGRRAWSAENQSPNSQISFGCIGVGG